MFGYIRPFKPRMQYYEFEIYQSFYCGLCKNLGRNYGQIFRLTLSYDFAFLGLIYSSYHAKKCIIERQHCIVHPFKKNSCLCSCENLDYTAAAAVIAVYHKICDEIEDSGFLKGMFCRLLRLFMKRGYHRAERLIPSVAEDTKLYMKEQFRLEREGCSSIDKACEPTARIMASIAGNISDNEDDRQALSMFGYHLGRFVYLADAYDDIEKDKKKGSYNPLLLNFTDIDGAKRFALNIINMSLSFAAEAYQKCGLKKFHEIIDNVLYLGLPRFYLLSKEEYRKNRNKKIEI